MKTFSSFIYLTVLAAIGTNAVADEPEQRRPKRVEIGAGYAGGPGFRIGFDGDIVDEDNGKFGHLDVSAGVEDGQIVGEAYAELDGAESAHTRWVIGGERTRTVARIPIFGEIGLRTGNEDSEISAVINPFGFHWNRDLSSFGQESSVTISASHAFGPFELEAAARAAITYNQVIAEPSRRDIIADPEEGRPYGKQDGAGTHLSAGGSARYDLPGENAYVKAEARAGYYESDFGSAYSPGVGASVYDAKNAAGGEYSGFVYGGFAF